MTLPTASAPPITHYENFPVASLLSPPHLRAPIRAIYHFARCADDLADEGNAPAQQRLLDLQAYRRDLSACTTAGFQSQRWPQVFAPLQTAIARHALPLQLLHDLLDAFVQDVEKTADDSGYASEAELLDYCRHSANPIGRLLLHLYGVTDPVSLAHSDAICSALQLINFWQDLSRDIPRSRHYLPLHDCERLGVDRADLLALRQTPAASALIASCAASARARMVQGQALVHRLPGRAGWELRLVVQGGLRILDKLQAQDFAALRQRPVLRWWDGPLLLWRALWM